MVLRHVIDIDEAVKLTHGQSQRSRSHPEAKHFWKYEMCLCDKQARLTYLRGVNVLVLCLPGCPDLSALAAQNALLLSTMATAEGTQVNVTCAFPDRPLVGASQLTCNPGATWSHELPSCLG